MERDLYEWKETCVNKKRPMEIKRDLCKFKETYPRDLLTIDTHTAAHTATHTATQTATHATTHTATHTATYCNTGTQQLTIYTPVCL